MTRDARALTLLDGPVGTRLAELGVPTPPPAWSAAALSSHPEVVRAVHREYAEAGATVHTAATFRTRPGDAGPRWEALARLAVALCRDAVPAHHRIAGSVAPVADCYRPDLSPPDARARHRELVGVLADEGVDLLLCETFAHPGEAWAAVEEAVATGIETWVALTAGPNADLLDAHTLVEAARGAVDRGAKAVLVNCVPANATLPFLRPLADLGVPFGAYANAGAFDEGLGWGAASGPQRYLTCARRWVDAGATLIGGCCGTGPAHVAALAAGLALAGDRG